MLDPPSQLTFGIDGSAAVLDNIADQINMHHRENRIILERQSVDSNADSGAD